MNAPCELAAVYAEQALVGAILRSAEAWDRVAGIVCEDDFAEHRHRIIWSHIGRIVREKKSVDAITVAESIDAAGESDSTGGLAYLGELTFNSTNGNVESYARIVADKSLLRRLLTASEEISELGRSYSSLTTEEKIGKAQSIILAITEVQNDSEPQEIGSLLSDVIEVIEARVARGGSISGVATGFADLDRITCGLQPGDLIIVAGRPSMGKTTLALNIAENVALDGGAAVVFSLEMGRHQLAERSIARLGSVSLTHLRSGQITETGYDGMGVALGKLNSAPLIIDDSSSLSAARIAARCRAVKRKRGALSVVVIDYLQLMRGEGNNRNEELGDITRQLKLMARELSCPVIVLSQLSRKCEERADKRPLLSDLRESGAIEQDADLVLMAYRDDYYVKDSAYKGLAEIIIRKHRMGALDTVHMVFQGEYSRFLDADHEAIAQAATASRQPRKKTGGFD